MALILCPECTHTISDKAGFCPSCGYPLKDAPQKRRKLPNGTGSVKRLSGKRSRKWAAYPHVTKFSQSGSPILEPAIGYFRTYEEAYQALILYNAAAPVAQISNRIIVNGLPTSVPPR